MLIERSAMSKSRRRQREPTISKASSNLNFADPKLLSKFVLDYWQKNYTRASFIELADAELERLADEFVKVRGAQIWDGTTIKDPVWPQRHNFIWANVTTILKCQRRNQKDQVARRTRVSAEETEEETSEDDDDSMCKHSFCC